MVGNTFFTLAGGRDVFGDLFNGLCWGINHVSD
jgi:hypothetical protein